LSGSFVARAMANGARAARRAAQRLTGALERPRAFAKRRTTRKDREPPSLGRLLLRHSQRHRTRSGRAPPRDGVASPERRGSGPTPPSAPQTALGSAEAKLEMGAGAGARRGSHKFPPAKRDPILLALREAKLRITTKGEEDRESARRIAALATRHFFSKTEFCAILSERS
jgi:hypothetical protein